MSVYPSNILEINPNYAEIWFERGIVLSNLGRKKEAFASFRKCNSINPDMVTNRVIKPKWQKLTQAVQNVFSFLK
ncbi:tetratricopeptide repeat protein [Stanieria cyanosphaera]|uniref:tetratricopeptide repeat protein n=1 Tax=Stanieria cyanosphaera TaxID=102116 RepID=UPI000A0409DD